jgi:hypothetical protein
MKGRATIDTTSPACYEIGIVSNPAPINSSMASGSITLLQDSASRNQGEPLTAAGSAMNVTFVNANGQPTGGGNSIPFLIGGGQTVKFTSTGTGAFAGGYAVVNSTLPVNGTAVFSLFYAAYFRPRARTAHWRGQCSGCRCRTTPVDFHRRRRWLRCRNCILESRPGGRQRDTFIAGCGWATRFIHDPDNRRSESFCRFREPAISGRSDPRNDRHDADYEQQRRVGGHCVALCPR